MTTYICETCQKVFTQESEFNTHIGSCNVSDTIIYRLPLTSKMTTYTCETCQKVFTQKRQYNFHKGSCNVIDTTIKDSMPIIDYNKKTKEELIAICKEKGIKGYSAKKKGELVDMIIATIKAPTVINDIVLPTKGSTDLTKLRVASLFAGCGGLDYGFYKNPRYTHVFVNDFDKEACDTYEKNFHIKPTCGDIKQIKTIPDCDILLGGFPCQGFSMANPYRSESDKRNELYLEILRLLQLKQPKYFLLENVKGLLNMGGYETKEDKANQTGKVLKVILKDLEECGYKVKFKLFDIKYFNVPQKRQRVIIIGVRNDIQFDPQWPEPLNTLITLKEAIGDLPIEYNPAIQHVGTKHKCAVTGYLGNRELVWDEPSPTITGRGGGSGGPVIHNHPSLKRRLTVRECARIQTFPDSFEFAGSISSMYKQLGNAVPCKFSEFLCRIFENAP